MAVYRNPPADPANRERILARLRRPYMRTLMHEHVTRALASVDREQERTTRVTPAALASARAADVAMHYRRMLHDYHG